MNILLDVNLDKTQIFSIDTKKHSKLSEFSTPARYSTFLELLSAYVKNKGYNNILINFRGLIDKKNSQVLRSTALPDYELKPITEDIEHMVSGNVQLESRNITNAMSFMDTYDSFIFIQMNQEIGGAYIRTLHNSLFCKQIEVGHHIVEPDGILCECGQRGCAKQYTANLAHEERFLTQMYSIEDKRILEDAADYISIAATNLCNMFKPQTLILSGRVFNEIESIKNTIIKKIYAKAKVIPPKEILIKNSNMITGARSIFNLIDR